jgi:hypothetical protein
VPEVNPLLALLLLGVAICWIVAVTLLRISRNYSDIKSLRERAIAAAVIAIGVSVYTFAAANVDAGGNEEFFRALARVAVVCIAIVPGSYWLWLFQRGRF